MPVARPTRRRRRPPQRHLFAGAVRITWPGPTRRLNQLGTVLLLGVLRARWPAWSLGLAVHARRLRPLDRWPAPPKPSPGAICSAGCNCPPGATRSRGSAKPSTTWSAGWSTTLEAQRRFVADASHELRTPLTSLKGLAEILMIGAHGNDSRVIEQSARRHPRRIGPPDPPGERPADTLAAGQRGRRRRRAAPHPGAPASTPARRWKRPRSNGRVAGGRDVRLTHDAPGPCG